MESKTDHKDARPYHTAISLPNARLRYLLRVSCILTDFCFRYIFSFAFYSLFFTLKKHQGGPLHAAPQPVPCDHHLGAGRSARLLCPLPGILRRLRRRLVRAVARPARRWRSPVGTCVYESRSCCPTLSSTARV